MNKQPIYVFKSNLSYVFKRRIIVLVINACRSTDNVNKLSCNFQVIFDHSNDEKSSVMNINNIYVDQ